jgi:hypothetical protein
LPLSVAAVTICLTAAPAAAASNEEFGIILPATDRLENGFDEDHRSLPADGRPVGLLNQHRQSVPAVGTGHPHDL